MIVIVSLRCSLSYFQQCELFGTISIVIASSKDCTTCSHWSILYNGIFCLHWELNEDCYFQIVWFRFSVVSLVPRRKSPRDFMGWKAMIFKVHSNPNYSMVLQLQTKGTRTGRAWDLPFRMTEPRAMGTAPPCGEKIPNWRLWRKQIQLWYWHWWSSSKISSMQLLSPVFPNWFLMKLKTHKVPKGISH